MGTVVGNWRLKLILIIFIFYVAIYGANTIFYDVETIDDYSDDKLIDFGDSNSGIVENETNLSISGKDEGNSFIDLLGGIFDWATFGNIDNVFARLFLNTTIAIMTIAIGYIIYTFIKEWIPLV